MLRLPVALLAVLALNAPAAASFAVALDLEALVGRADQVVVGRVLAQQPRWDGGRIVTDILIEVDEVFAGDAAVGTVLQLVRFGGAIGELGMRIEGEPSFEDGASYVLFLRQWRGLYRPVGMSQGVLPIEEEDGAPMVQPGGAGLALVTRPGGTRAFGALRGPRPLSSLRERIRALVEP